MNLLGISTHIRDHSVITSSVTGGGPQMLTSDDIEAWDTRENDDRGEGGGPK